MKLYTKPTEHDNPLPPLTPNSLARLSEYQPDAHAALERNADAFALHEAERQRKVLPFNRKTVPQVIARDGGLEAA